VLALAEFSGAAKIVHGLNPIARHYYAIREPVMLESSECELDVFGIILDQQNAFREHHCTVPFRKLR
jgi:hypothetical protein